MTTERWKQVKEIFASTLEHPPAERAAWIWRACGFDAELRREVESLLGAHDQAGDFIESPPLESENGLSTDTLAAPPENAPDTAIGRRIGAYRTVREIGRGGMGAVYLAVRADDEFERRVAIKLIRRGLEMDFIIRRFRNERQILANLDHPFIARLLDGGTTDDGLPYFVMEYVEGRPLHHYSDQNHLPAGRRIELFLKVCSAVEYAHRNQIIHRDLKPGNVLVTEDGMPKLLDFGIAKLLDLDVTTHDADPATLGFRMMTPAYASPEQLRGEPPTTASDIYSLGVVLCELLTGKRPGRDSRRELINDGPPLEERIENIIRKAIEEEPSQRYASVELLANDLRRYLDGQLPAAPDFLGIPSANVDNTSSTGPKSIAILPFQTMGVEDKSDAYLGVGMADALIIKLTNVRRIEVRPTSSVLKYAESEPDLVAAARELDVMFVLTGRLRHVGDRVRITVQLVRGRDGTPMWAAKFDEKFTDILNLEDSLSEQVAQAVVERITLEERAQLHKRGTQNPLAYQAYLKGKYYWNSYSVDGMAKALIHFNEALAHDPHYAHAMAGVADYYTWLGVWSMLPPKECFAATKDAALRALDLDPTLAEAHSSLAVATWSLDRNWEAAEQGFARAMELSPDFAQPHQWHAYMASARGRHADAMSGIERARRLNPLAPNLAAGAALVYYNAGRYDRGIEHLLESDRVAPQQFVVQQAFGWLYGRKKMFAEALAASQRALTLSNRHPAALWTFGWLLASAGRNSEARQVLAELEAQIPERYVSPYFRAMILAELGEIDRALDLLEQSCEDRDWWAMWIGVEPRWDALRQQTRFQQLLAKVGLPSQIQTADCSPSAEPEKAPASRSEFIADIRPAGLSSSRSIGLYIIVCLALIAVALLLAKTLFVRKTRPFENIQVTRLTTNGNAATAAISPDGKYVAFTLDEDGKQGLWIRQTGVAASVRIVPPGEAQLRVQSFSHDGTRVYYTAYPRNDLFHASVYEVPVLGGQTRKIVDDTQSPITLSPDHNQIAFIRNKQAQGRDDLIIAGLDGSRERIVISRKHPDRFAFASMPAWSPDGKSIATAVESTDARGQYVHLVAMPVSGGEQKLLSPERWHFVEGLAWLAGGSDLVIIGQRPEATFQQVWEINVASGKARRITSDLCDYLGVSVTGDSRALATVQFQILSSVWVARGGDISRAVEVTPGSGRYYDLAWTPDFKLLYASDASDTVDLWMREQDGSAPRQLTTNGHRNYGPAVSPDGKHIAFHTNRTGNWNIWEMDRDGGNPHPLTTDNKMESNWAHYASDGKSIIYQRSRTGGELRLWKMPAEGGPSRQITSSTCTLPAVSLRDGGIACWFTDDDQKLKWEIAILPPDGGRPLKTFPLPPSVSIQSAIRWSPDGRAVHYIDNRGGASNIWSQPVDGSPARPLTDFKTGQIFSFDWARDGRLAYSRGIQTADVVLIKEIN